MSVNNDNSDSSNTNNYSAVYDATNKKSYNSQREVTNAWMNLKFPTHNRDQNGAAIVYTGSPEKKTNAFGRSRAPDVDGTRTNFYGSQRTDGSGTLWHYSTREAVRLEDGTVINNQQCWNAGFAKCSAPHDYDWKLPFSALETEMNQHDNIRSVTDVYGQPEYNFRNGEVTETHNVEDSLVIVNDGEYGVYLGRDKSVKAEQNTLPTASQQLNLVLFLLMSQKSFRRCFFDRRRFTTVGCLLLTPMSLLKNSISNAMIPC